MKTSMFSREGSEEMRKSSAFIAAMLIVLILAASCSPSTPAVRDITDNEYAMLGIAMMPIVTAFIPGTDPPFVTMTNSDSHTAIIEFDYDKIEGEGFKDGSGAVMTLVFEEDITGLDYRLLPDSGYGSLDFDVTVITTNGLEYRFEVIAPRHCKQFNFESDCRMHPDISEYIFQN